MKKIFISVPVKLLTLIIGTLLLVSIGFSMISLSRLNQEFKHFQADTLKKGQAQFEIHSEILRSQLQIWLESYADIVQLKEQNDFTVLAKGLTEQFDGLQLNYNVQNMWLFDDFDSVNNQQALFKSIKVPEYVKDSVETVFRIQQPTFGLYCQPFCEQLVVVPLLNKQGQ